MHAHVTLHGPPNTRHTASARRKSEPVRRAKLSLLCARPQPLTPTRCNIYTTQHGAASPWPAQERARSIRNALRCPTRAFACLARVARRRMGESKKVSNYSIASRTEDFGSRPRFNPATTSRQCSTATWHGSPLRAAARPCRVAVTWCGNRGQKKASN